jgi:site-specific DNA-methyltransferase (adenine-specific)
MTLEINKIYNMDCLEGLKQLENNSIDLIITDPPYSIEYKSNFGSKKYKEKIHNHKWDKDFDFSLYFKEIYKKLKDNSFMYVFGRFENYNTMVNLGCNRVLIWDKGHNGMGDLKDWGIGFEVIYLFKKGKPTIKGNRENCIIRYDFYGSFGNAFHPTEKPLNLIKYIITKSVNKKSLVLDCFMGSGTTAIACQDLEHNYIGFEIDKNYFEKSNKRININKNKVTNYFKV